MTLREKLGRADEPLDPEVERELATIDAVLAAGGIPGPSDESPDSAGLARLTRELRAERGAPDPDFAARLDRWAAEGFPRQGELRPARRNVVDDGPAWVSALRRRLAASPPRRIIAPAGAALTFAVVVAVGVGALSGRDE